MSREIRGRVHSKEPHPTLCGAHLITILIPGHAEAAITERMEATIVIPEAGPFGRSADA